jgi:urease accessory protein
MRRAVATAKPGQWPRDQAIGRVTLPYDERHQRRRRWRTNGGDEILLDLPHAAVLSHGDGLALDDGNWIEVHAADEDLMEIRAVSPLALSKLAWHLGNRHLPAQIEEDRILIRPDHVIAHMLQGLGATVRPVQAPFMPEGGAYSGHAHDH